MHYFRRMSERNILSDLLKKHSADFSPVVPYRTDKHIVAKLDLTRDNPAFSDKTYETTESLSRFIDEAMTATKADYLIGGYQELRDMYRRSNLFDQNLDMNAADVEEPRSLHMGIDIWAAAGTPVFAPLDGVIQSFANNNNFGDYGATIILQHELENVIFYTLYGHLSARDIENLEEGDSIKKGQEFAHFGPPGENGHWPPHLHFQVIEDLKDFKGDYPGVVKPSERDYYCSNCPDPNLILNFIK